jgi:arylsulfatase A-like enzyme
MLMLNHKAPHRPWEPDQPHSHLYPEGTIPEPPTFDDEPAARTASLEGLRMSMWDLDDVDLKVPVPAGLSRSEERSWRYQRYMADYLRCVASVDDNVGRVLDWLEQNGLTQSTLVIYTSDQGFFLGDHGWYDKRLMYEESLRMPFVASYPPLIPAGTSCDDIVTNVDIAPTLLELAGIPLPERLQGHSMVRSLQGQAPSHPQTAVYYRYWEHLSDPHRVPAHIGIRTRRHKLIAYLDAPDAARATELELFDLDSDTTEVENLVDDPAHAGVLEELTAALGALQREVRDPDPVVLRP